MLQHVQHQNERVLLPRLKIAIKRADENAVSIRIGRVDQVCKRLHSLDVAEFPQARKKQSIAAADVENSIPSGSGPDAAQGFYHELAAGAPPPVFLEELAIAF